MTEPRAGRVNGVILAGGRSRRMAGVDKRFAPLAGRGLLQRVIDRAAPQVDRLLLNGPDSDKLAGFGLPVVADRRDGYRGPLMGLYSALTWCADQAPCDWLALFACDTPFLPHNLVARLRQGAETVGRPVAVAQVQKEAQPTASLWHHSLLADLEAAVLEQEMAGFWQFLRQCPWAAVDWGDEDSWHFFNINSPDDLAAATALLPLLDSEAGDRPC